MRDKGGVDVRMTIRADGAPDPRRYNAPTAPEIAVIMPGDGYTEGVATRDIVLHARTGGLKLITETNCAYDSLLMFYCFLQEITAGIWAGFHPAFQSHTPKWAPPFFYAPKLCIFINVLCHAPK